MKYLTSGNPIVDAMGEINISGNVTPQIWYKTILRENGKPYLLAIAILSDIVYWYRPVEVRDEENGGTIGWRKRFKSDLLQKSYRQYAELFGESIRSIEAAMKYLQSIGVITRVPRDVKTENGAVLYNVTFLQLNVDKLYELTYPSEDLVQNFVGGTTKFCTTPHNEKRALKNISFLIKLYRRSKKLHQYLVFLVEFTTFLKLKDRFSGYFSYFLLINLTILLRFTAKIVIAPCISMPIRPDDDATS